MKHLSTEELALYVESLKDKSTNKLPQDILNHIAACNECASEVIEFYEIVKDDAAVSAKQNKIRPLYYLSAAVAASLLIFLIVNFDLFKVNNSNNQISGNGIPNDTIQITDQNNAVEDSLVNQDIEDSLPQNNTIEKIIPEKKILIAEYQQPNSNLEKLVDRYRGTLRGKEIEIITPIELRLKKDSPIVLKWNTQEEIELSVEIFNNKAEKIDEATITNGKYKTAAIKSIGLYYWKLFNEDFDLIFCGKIVIE